MINLVVLARLFARRRNVDARLDALTAATEHAAVGAAIVVTQYQLVVVLEVMVMMMVVINAAVARRRVEPLMQFQVYELRELGLALRTLERSVAVV